MPEEPSEGYVPISNDLLEPSDDFPGMCGLTTYNRVSGHFFLKKMPSPKNESITRTIQGLTDRFESSYEDTTIESLIAKNEKVNITQTVYQGEINDIQTSSSIGTLTATGSGDKVSSIMAQGGYSYHDGSANVLSSGKNTIVAIAVEDVRLFALKNLDVSQEALFDFTDPQKPTNEDYVHHLTPEKESRIAIIESPSDLIAAGGPPKILVYYNAIDTTGEVVAGWKSSAFGAGVGGSNSHATTENDVQAINQSSSRGWLVVERTVPDANTIYIEDPTGSPEYRPLIDWLRYPYAGAVDNTWTPLTIHSPGGIISIPTTNLQRPIKSHMLQMNPSGDTTSSPFINIENCAHTVIQNSIAGMGDRYEGYGPPIAQPNTRSPITDSKSAYNLLSISVQGEGVAIVDDTYASQQPVVLEQFDIIDNIIEGNNHLLLIHPKNKQRANTLTTLLTKQDSDTQYHKCTIELMLMKGRIEEITPNSGEMEGGVIVRGRSQLMDISDRTSQRDFNLSEGYPLKEIGDLGSPSVTLSMGGLGQGGIDINPSRTEHPFLPVWKDKVVGSGNASVRNDRQTSTYYASTRALVEIPLFPSMFFDIEKRLATSTDNRTPLPSSQSMELSLDCTMTAINRPQMQNYENRWSIDWGLKNIVSALTVNDWATVSGKAWIRCMRENATTYLTAYTYAGGETEVVTGTLGGSDAYIEVDSFLPFTTESSFSDVATTLPSKWTIPDGGFLVTVGEGIISQRGIRLHISHLEQNSNVYKMYFDQYQDWDNNTLSEADLRNKLIVGLPVTLGSWLTDDASAGVGTVAAITGATVAVSTSASTMAQAFIAPIEKALGLRIGNPLTSICIDPDDDTTILIHNGPSMEGFSFDPGNYLYGNDDLPLLPPIECRASYYALQGKKGSGDLWYVRPQRIKLGDIASKGSVSDFNTAVNELIRTINQASHPLAKNENGGSAFDAPLLFSESAGTHTVSSTDTGSHMGYIRAFAGKGVESRDGESGTSIVIHSTIPGATGRNFAVWFSNHSPYPYRPIQAVGHGGLLATNSRSYQAGSFPAPLPIGMDGETHIPITTFQGGVHGLVENAGDELRTYSGIGQEITFNTVLNPKNSYGNTLPSYDPETQSTLWVERKALDIIRRIDRNLSASDRATILVNNTDYGTFRWVAGGQGGTDCKVSGTGACAALADVQPLNQLSNKWKDLFVNSDGSYKQVEIKLIHPLIDAHGILFFGGGHTGVTFDISDGTANDYSDFYTHHYAKGPSGYSGFQNLQEVQTSAAILDFSNLKNADTVKENTYRGLHHRQILTNTGTTPENSHLLSQETQFYIRLGDLADYTGDYANYQHVKLPIEKLHGSKLLVYSDWEASAQRITAANGPIVLDGESGAVIFSGTDYIAAHEIEKNNPVTPKIKPLVNVLNEMKGANAAWSISFFMHPNIVGAWPAVSQDAYGTGPVLHGIDHNGFPWGVSIVSKQIAMTTYEFKVIGHFTDSAGNAFHAESVSSGTVAKDAWYHVVFTYSNAAGPTCYINAVAKTLTPTPNPLIALTDDATYRGGTVGPHLPHINIGIGYPLAPGTYPLINHPSAGTYAVGSTDTVAVDTVSPLSYFSIGDSVQQILPTSGNFYGKIKSMNATSITFESPIETALANNQALTKIGAHTATSLFGRDKNMVLIGLGLHTYGPPATYFYGTTISNPYDPTYFLGRLSEVALWNKVLSPSEVTTLFNARSVWD